MKMAPISLECSRCARTIVLLHCSRDFLEPSGVKIGYFDAGSKSKLIPSSFNSVSKTRWTTIIEGVVDYCRIVFDLFPEQKKVSVNACISKDDVRTINDFSAEGQTITELMKGFTKLGLPPANSGGTAALLSGLKLSLETLLKPKNQEKKLLSDENVTCKRIVILTAFESSVTDSVISMLKDTIRNTLEQLNISNLNSQSLDIVCVNITTDIPSANNEVIKVTSNVALTTIFFKPQHVSDKLISLVKTHFNLNSTTVTGIPMKEEQHAGSSANYDVELIHPAEAHHEIDKLNSVSTNVQSSFVKKESTPKVLVVLKWCTPKSNASVDLQPCIAVYRVTPSDVNSRHAACLISFLLQGRNVSLEQPRKSGSKLITHMLASHGGDIFMHVLVPGRSPLEDPPSISEGCGGRVTDYRIGDFGEFMKENRLAPYPETEVSCLGDRPNSKALDKLERCTRHWPMVISDTLLYNMSKHLEPLLSVMVKGKLIEDDIQNCKKVIYRLQAMESRNDTLPLPIISLRGKGNRREDQYRQLWSELDLFLEGASKTSSNHKKVLECLRGTLDIKMATSEDLDKDTVMSDAASVAVSTKSQMDQITWKEVDRSTPSGEFEKRNAPSPIKLPPTDPRRRNIKRKEEDDSPVQPPKRFAAGTSTVTRKTGNSSGHTSILAMFQSRIANSIGVATAEFEGRLNAVHGKTELYQDLKKESSTVS